MAVFLTTSRFGITYPDPSTRSASADVPRDLAAIATVLDGAGVMYSEGTLASRPAAGKHGRFYYATDNSHLYYDFGSNWLDITAAATLADGSVTLAKLAANSVDATKIVDASVGTAELAAGAVTAAKIAAALFPSQGAGAGTEALRAIGVAAGQVAAGNDARFRTEIVGHVNANASIASGSGFSVGFAGPNTYTVTFTTPFSAAPIVLAQQVGGTCLISSATVNSFAVATQGATTGEFYFRAILPF